MPPRGGGGGNEPGFPPVRKSLGQHFLSDRAILERIADAVELTGTETVIEIGPGRGALTDILVERAGRLIAIEYDRALAAKLVERYAGRRNVEIVQADVLTVRFGALAGGPYHLIGNVPYYITTPIIFQALEPPRPDLAVYLVQREVAERLVAPPGGGDYGALTVNVGAVESAVVRVTPKPQPLVVAEEEAKFRAFVQSIFTMRRKQMQRILRSVSALSIEAADVRLREIGVDPMARPETLTVSDFAALYRASQ